MHAYIRLKNEHLFTGGNNAHNGLFLVAHLALPLVALGLLIDAEHAALVALKDEICDHHM